ncbi:MULTISPECIES: hypothetical protein [Gimesia]|uniref:Xylose isomerase-like TIM barrel domain-containing protein n=1 Tax=Gimesia chilikensis TaxID=2605989 RepID=A0A517PYA1_9PLAN|nr:MULTISPECIES: hypothetical protein [Gimesia]MAX38820.1 hypothetical protein [Gimesia sp.]QDT24365.1 hypothetical protein HG66A1_61970 [Gimesia chilikensis]|tara:strand:- start:37399 stop:38196 length:798 start_codon:yes stop_codon:yes gene_type:complete
MKIGFSTGSIALDDVRRGLRVATHQRANAVELSALREDELDPLLESLDRLENDLLPFEYVSFHAPSKRTRFSESEFVEKLRKVADRGWAIIVHPDVIEDFSLWRSLGPAVCIENMDKRKEIGRTAAQLRTVFEKLPDATFCFDIGHARQVDPTMQEAETFLELFHDRLRQVHMSYVNSQSRHERLNFESIRAFQRVAHWLSEATPIILETPVKSSDIDDEIKSAESVFSALWCCISSSWHLPDQDENLDQRRQAGPNCGPDVSSK